MDNGMGQVHRVMNWVRYTLSEDFADQSGVRDPAAVFSAFALGLCFLAGLVGFVIGAVVR